MIVSSDKDYMLKMIKKYPIETLHINGRLKQEEAQLYLDDLDQPRVGVLVHDGWMAPFSEDPDAMVDALTTLIDKDHVSFCGLPLNMANPIIEGLVDFRMKWVEECVLYYLPEAEYETYLEADTSLDDLQEKDIPIIDKYYTYRSDDSQDYLLACIRRGPSSVVRDDQGQPISWALLREDGSLGVMYTLEAYRKQGLALTVSRDLIKKVIKAGYQPYVHIVVDNYPSRNLAEHLNMVHYDEILWFGMERIKD